MSVSIPFPSAEPRVKGVASNSSRSKEGENKRALTLMEDKSQHYTRCLVAAFSVSVVTNSPRIRTDWYKGTVYERPARVEAIY